MAEPIAYFKCSCNASARFLPVYRFQQAGSKPSVAMGDLCPATVMCANCKVMYVWEQTTPEQDGGWRKQSPLDDLIALEAAGG